MEQPQNMTEETPSSSADVVPQPAELSVSSHPGQTLPVQAAPPPRVNPDSPAQDTSVAKVHLAPPLPVRTVVDPVDQPQGGDARMARTETTTHENAATALSAPSHLQSAAVQSTVSLSTGDVGQRDTRAPSAEDTLDAHSAVWFSEVTLDALGDDMYPSGDSESATPSRNVAISSAAIPARADNAPQRDDASNHPAPADTRAPIAATPPTPADSAPADSRDFIAATPPARADTPPLIAATPPTPADATSADTRAFIPGMPPAPADTRALIAATSPAPADTRTLVAAPSVETQSHVEEVGHTSCHGSADAQSASREITPPACPSTVAIPLAMREDTPQRVLAGVKGAEAAAPVKRTKRTKKPVERVEIAHHTRVRRESTALREATEHAQETALAKAQKKKANSRQNDEGCVLRATTGHGT